MKELMLPYCEERKMPITMLVLHCNAFSGEKCMQVFNEYKVSTHYVIDEKGELIKCVSEEKTAYHAGKGFWRGQDCKLNASSIGIEICSQSLGQDDYDEVQIKSLIALLKQLIAKYKIEAVNIVGHSDIAPTRKADPGKAFPWKRLYDEGIGVFYNIKDADKIKTNNIEKLLAQIGYDTRDDEAIKASAYAFCRHFFPQFVISETVETLIDNPLIDNFDFMQDVKFLETLKATVYAYCKASNAPCNI